MKIIPLSPKMVDVFLNQDTSPTGYEESCWLRLQKRGELWLQIGGIKVPSWKFKQITTGLTPNVLVPLLNKFNRVKKPNDQYQKTTI